MEPHVYTWSFSGELLEAVPLSSFAVAHDIDARDLFTRLLLVQAVVGREPVSGLSWLPASVTCF